MRKLLWVGDAGCPSGFARATHEILNVLRETWDVYVLGMNYRGDPDGFPEFLRGRIWACAPGGDALGVGRLIWMMDNVKPDVVLFQNDPWHIKYYTAQLDKFKKEYGHVTRVGAIAVDGKNCQGAAMNGLDAAVFWTQFGVDEARQGGYKKPASVVPLGVDSSFYTPGDRAEARRRRKFPESHVDAFVVGNVNRNQPRKRLDLTIEYFAQWVKEQQVDDAYLYLHVAPTGDEGFDCQALARYYGIGPRLIMAVPEVFYGNTEAEMLDTYRSFDVQISTTAGEGFGLTTFEGMACGVPQIVPDWSALGELTKDAATLIPCTTTAAAPNINTIGGLADKDSTIAALHMLYENKEARRTLGQLGRDRACERRFAWRAVGEGFRDSIAAAVAAPILAGVAV